MAGTTGLEPSTSAVTGQILQQLTTARGLPKYLQVVQDICALENPHSRLLPSFATSRISRHESTHHPQARLLEADHALFQFDAPISSPLEYELYRSPAGDSMANVPASGIEPGQRRLNGPQTTGREYRNLSPPTHAMAQDDDVAVPMRDGINLLVD